MTFVSKDTNITYTSMHQHRLSISYSCLSHIHAYVYARMLHTLVNLVA